MPFITYGPLNALVFGLYGTSLKLLEKSDEPSLKSVFLAGTIGKLLYYINRVRFTL